MPVHRVRSTAAYAKCAIKPRSRNIVRDFNLELRRSRRQTKDIFGPRVGFDRDAPITRSLALIRFAV